MIESQKTCLWENRVWIAAVFGIVIGGLVLAGWIFDVEVLKSVVPGFQNMKANTALCFILIGIALWAGFVEPRPSLRPEPPMPGRDRKKSGKQLARICLSLVLALAAMTLFEYLSRINLGLDEALFQDATPGNVPPGRMAFSTAASFLFLTIALLMILQPQPSRNSIRAASVLGLLTLLLGGISVLDYFAHLVLFGIGAFLPFIPMALPTALLFVLLGVVSMQLLWRQAGWVWSISGGLAALFSLGLVLLFILSMLSHKALERMIVTSDWLRRSQEIQSKIRDVSGDLVDIQGTVRGYVITGQSSYERACEAALERLEKRLVALRKLVGADPPQLDRLRMMEERIRERLRFDEELVALRRAGASEQAAELIASGLGQQLREEIIEVRTQLLAVERKVAKAREEQSGAWIARSFLILPAGTYLGMLLFLAAFLKLNAEVTDRRRTELAARESAERLRAIFEQAASGIVRVDPGGRFLEVNERYAEIVGRSRAELLGCTFQDITHPEDLAADLDHARELVAGRIKTYSMEKRYLRPDRSVVWVNLTVSLVREPGGKSKYFIGVVEDITLRKEKEAELRRIEWLLTPKGLPRISEQEVPAHTDMRTIDTERLILDTVGEPTLKNIASDYLDLLGTFSAIYEKNGDYALRIFSSGWCRFLDSSSRKICAKDDTREALACGQWHCHEACWTKTSKVSIETDAPVDTDCPGGIRLYADPIRAGGQVVGSINFGYGDSPRAEGQLHELAQKFGVTVEALRAQAMAYETRPPYIIELAKRRLQASARLIGEMIDRRLAENEVRLLNADLERRVAERTSALQAANQELDSFCYSASHDLRTPLRAIDGFSKILLHQHAAELSPEALDSLQTIRGSAQEMGRLIEDLLSFSRLNSQPLRKNSVQPRELIEQCLQTLQPEQEGRQIEIDIGPLPPGQADASLWKLVWMNLLANALKYTRHSRPARLEIGALEKPESPSIYFVRDNGVGFQMEYAGKLFGVFQRLHRSDEFEGTGVGLATAQRILHRHGGRIWAEAELNKGATFYFTIEPS